MITTGRKIPLNSLVILIGDVDTSRFPSYEVIDSSRILYDLTGDEDRQDLNYQVWNEIHRRVTAKLSIGERVVVKASVYRKNTRLALSQYAARMGLPIFYLIAPSDDLEYRNNERDLMRGDGVAEVLLSSNPYTVVEKFTGDIFNLVKERFNGITAVGDIHGCVTPLRQALEWASSRNHLTVILGDLIDYGPNPLECVEVVYRAVTRGHAIMVIGNHERKIERWIVQSRKGDVRVKISDGNKVTTDAISALSAQDREVFELRFKALLNLAHNHWVAGNVMFTHGAATKEMWDITSSRLTDHNEHMALFGQTITPHTNPPTRVYGWVDDIPQGKTVIVGHDIRSKVRPHTEQGKSGGTAIFADCGSGKGGHSFAVDLVIDDDKLTVQNFIQN